MADADFITRAELTVEMNQQIDLFDDGAGATSTAKQDTALEAARTEIWAGIKQYDVYTSATKVFDYATKIAGTRSEGLLKGYCLTLTRWWAYQNTQQSIIPEAVDKEAQRVRQILADGINLPDILLLNSTGTEPDGILVVTKATARLRETDLKDW